MLEVSHVLLLDGISKIKVQICGKLKKLDFDKIVAYTITRLKDSYIYIYVYIERERERDRQRDGGGEIKRE